MTVLHKVCMWYAYSLWKWFSNIEISCKLIHMSSCLCRTLQMSHQWSTSNDAAQIGSLGFGTKLYNYKRHENDKQERDNLSVESVGEHVQISDDQGWVQLEVEEVCMLFPSAGPREMSLSAHNHFVLKRTHIISELNRHQYAHVSVSDNIVWFGCSRALVPLPVWLCLKHTGMSALAYWSSLSKPPAQTQTLELGVCEGLCW